ncbi:efflux RND transporter periplasmic adaptor subunit, partial [Coleofasciculus sp. LEGE 07092]|uniref:efflux RND transporter periplasmic adaptor subunit n=2 Tax=unclassified Coleofasciculus TaxID=2692782 RepID=UPI00187E5511
MGKVKQPLPWIMGLMAAGILIVGGTGYFVIAAKPSKPDIEELTVPVQAQNLTVRIAANGTVQPVQTVNLSPKTAGRLVKLEVEQGEEVEAGEVIAVMEPAELKAQFIKAQADLKQAQVRWAEAKAGSRPEEIAQARARLAQAQARLDEVAKSRPEEIAQARARLAQAQARLDEAEVGNPSEIKQVEAQVIKALSQRDLAQARVRRNQSLLVEGAISQDRFHEVLTEARNAEANLLEAQQRLEQVRSTKNRTSPEIIQLEAAVDEAKFALQQLIEKSQEQITQLKASVAEAVFALQQLQNGTRKEEVAQLEAAVVAAQAQAQTAYIQFKDTEITAPFSGIITQKYATVGAFVTPTTSASSTASATSTSIVALATKELEVLAEVPEVDVGQIKERQRVEIISDAFPDKIFQGQVRLVAPEAIEEQNVTSFQVRVALAPEAQKVLRSGMNVDLAFLGEPISNALVVPTVAIVTQDGETGVMVPDLDNQPEFKPVTIGPTINDKTQILRGLRQGNQVFIDLPEDFRRKQEQEE